MFTKAFWKDAGVTFGVALITSLVFGAAGVIDAENLDAAFAAITGLARASLIAGFAAIAPRFRAFRDDS